MVETAIGVLLFAVMSLGVPLLSSVRTVQVFRDISDAPEGERLGGLVVLGMIGLGLTALAGWLAVCALVALMFQKDPGGMGAFFILVLLIVPYAISEGLVLIGR